ncbi:Dfp1/Him1, central region-domain-containing protein [Schizophyllum amplum]|uniref:Dfp1/Him1, central region-domain-containing protein n=1 Tax=Schizophyllum amplum TaxID=97359 RepID=A0A550CXY4_9AGAR|nr:Dfp1/Him1, central region-domain-containing protein [Auriculariopsis ampla]
MAALNRRPLLARPHPQIAQLQPPSRTASAASCKRPPSPGLGSAPVKRLKTTSSVPQLDKPKQSVDPDRERRRTVRHEEWQRKWRNHVPTCRFYFDERVGSDSTALAHSKLRELRGDILDFYDLQEMTHLITTKDRADAANALVQREEYKENGALKMLKRLPKPFKTNDDVVLRALRFKKKSQVRVWSIEKLEHWLGDILDGASSQSVDVPAPRPERDLALLLRNERIHGTSERDPTQKRNDYKYFSKNSHFVLVEDIREELATVIAHEYVMPKSKTVPPWPVAHCDHRARGPFTAYDDREKRRHQKAMQEEEEEREGALYTQYRLLKAQRHVWAQNDANRPDRRAGDLRRTVSLSNMRRREEEELEDEDATTVDLDDSQYQAYPHGSGYMASGQYMAASGNSMSITSAAGTTTSMSNAVRNLSLPASLQGRIDKEIVTSRKPGGSAQIGDMGPPDRMPVLRKSKSTNTMRQVKRAEGMKPGYCEACRRKFEHFEDHITTRGHRKFAENPNNYVALDDVLSRVKRHTLQDVDEERRLWEARRPERLRQATLRRRAATRTVSEATIDLSEY